MINSERQGTLEYSIIKLLSLLLLLEFIISAYALNYDGTLQARNVWNHKNPSKTKPRSYRSRTMDLSEIEITCTDTAGSFVDGTTCLDGSIPPNVTDLIMKPDHMEKTALWYSTDNSMHLRNVRKVEEDCSKSCKSDTCFYSLKLLDYICGLNGSEAFKAARMDMYDVELAHFNSRLFPAGMICWKGKLNGEMFDPLKTNLPDIELTKWYHQRFENNEKYRTRLEESMSKQCKTKECEFSKKKAAFVCAGRGQKLYPFSLAVFLVMKLGILVLKSCCVYAI